MYTGAVTARTGVAIPVPMTTASKWLTRASLEGCCRLDTALSSRVWLSRVQKFIGYFDLIVFNTPYYEFLAIR